MIVINTLLNSCVVVLDQFAQGGQALRVGQLLLQHLDLVLQTLDFTLILVHCCLFILPRHAGLARLPSQRFPRCLSRPACLNPLREKKLAPIFVSSTRLGN